METGDGVTASFRHGVLTRVLVNALHAKTGGGITYLRNVVPLLAAEPDLEVHLLVGRRQVDIAGTIPETVRLHVAEVPERLLSLLVWEQIALPTLAAEMGCDVLFSPANYGPLFASRQVVMLRNAPAVGRTEHRLSKWLYWKGLAAATALSMIFCRHAVAVSRYAAGAMAPRRIAGKITVVPHGVSPFFVPADTPRGSALLAVSDIYIQKNLHVLIDAFGRVAPHLPGVVLHIAGRVVDADYHADLQRQISVAGLGERVTFLGHCDVERLRELYRACALFVFPSTVETFGNPLLEAMACGAPVLCSNTTAIPEVAGDAAAYFSPTDPQELADQIRRLLADDGARARLSAAGLARAAGFSWQASASTTAGVLRRVAHGRGR